MAKKSKVSFSVALLKNNLKDHKLKLSQTKNYLDRCKPGIGDKKYFKRRYNQEKAMFDDLALAISILTKKTK